MSAVNDPHAERRDAKRRKRGGMRVRNRSIKSVILPLIGARAMQHFMCMGDADGTWIHCGCHTKSCKRFTKSDGQKGTGRGPDVGGGR